MSAEVAISKWALQLAGESPSKLEAPSSKLPEALSKRLSILSTLCVREAVTRTV